ncbi:MAG: NERD domain-containing protein [Elainellaceae cyanobacterium]
MRNLFGTIGRFILIGSAAFGIASYANLRHYESYWNGTIRRVQTVDFNMLSHMLPTKLSQALIEGDEQEIQRTLDSNYGLFGLVVTDCKTVQPDCFNQQIQRVSNSNLLWRDLLNEDNLATSTYDVLRDPPPLYAEGSYDSSRDHIRNATGLNNSGRIIGRVYYVRGVPPTFLGSYLQWILSWPKSFLSDSGANRYYALTTILFGAGGLWTWIFVESIHSKHRHQERQAKAKQEQLQAEQENLVLEAQILRQQLQEKFTENLQLIEERNQNLADLQAAQSRQQKREFELQSSLQNLQSRLSAQDQVNSKEKQRQIELQNIIQQKQREAELLREKMIALQAQQPEKEQERQQLQKKIADLQREQQTKHKRLEQHVAELDELWQELSIQSAEREEKAKLAELLSQEVEEAKRQQREALQQKENLQKSIEQLSQESRRDKQRLNALESQIKDGKQQVNELKSVISDVSRRSLNHFERAIIQVLEDSSKVKSLAWLILPQLDVSESGRNSSSKVTDCVLIGKSFVVVVEAKNYLGKIQSLGDVKRTSWQVSSDGNKGMEIGSCWGNNPYQQVDSYTKSVMKIIQDKLPWNKNITHNKVSCYGVVVFPDNADLTMLDTDLGSYYRITNLSSLLDVIHKLERQAQQQSRSGHKSLSPQEIEAYLCGKPLPKSA